jgi:hypothetical protein
LFHEDPQDAQGIYLSILPRWPAGINPPEGAKSTTNIEFGAAQGGDADTIALGGYLDGALGRAARLQVVAQPLGGKLALGQTGAGGTGGEEILLGEVAEARPMEIASFSDPVIERRSQRPKVRFDVQESGLRGCVGRAADEKLGTESGGTVHGCPTSMGRPAGGGFGEVANEENAAAVKLRQAGETIDKRACLRSAIGVNLPEIVPGIEDHEVGLGFLERVLKIAEGGVRRGHGTRRGDSQDDQGLGLEVGEVNDICAGYGCICIRGQWCWRVRRKCIAHQGLLWGHHLLQTGRLRLA